MPWLLSDRGEKLGQPQHKTWCYWFCRYLELVSQLEERDRTTENTIQGLDKELSLQQQANESHRKRTEESLQELTKVQLQAAEQQKLMDTVQQFLASRTDECEKESQLYKRCVTVKCECWFVMGGGPTAEAWKRLLV